MTDYLEELLEQQESQEEGAVPDWRERHPHIWGRQTAGERTAVREAMRPKSLTEENGLQTFEQTAVQTAWQERARQLSLMARMARLNRAVRQAQRQGGGRTAAVQVSAQQETTQMLHAGALSLRRTADYAAAVDAAFQRDARRYDGPLGLL